jgi:hypothetical protein
MQPLASPLRSEVIQQLHACCSVHANMRIVRRCGFGLE